MKTENIEYHDGDNLLEGYLAYDDKVTGKRPAVLVAHDWSGRNEFACQKAKNLAELGYVGFALDMFGKGIIGNTKEEKSALIQPFVQDRKALLNRLLKAVETVKQLEMVDAQKISMIGFCFGGLCALDLARSGADVKGTVSFHGILSAPEGLPKHQIKSKVLVLHGFDDPMATPEQAIAFGHEMTEAKANWELNMYGNVVHAFTNPQANDKDFGTVFNEQANQRSWVAMKNFLTEVFA